MGEIGHPGRLESIQYLILYPLKNAVYHYEIQENGRIFRKIRPWHCLYHCRETHGDWNDENTIAIGIASGKKAWESAQILVEWLQGQYHIPGKNVLSFRG